MFLLTTGVLPDEIGFIILIYLLVYLIICTHVGSLTVALSLGAYLLQGFGMQKMLRTLGFKKSWYAFVPICNSYALGYIADRYDEQNGKTKYAKRLLGLSIALFALALVTVISIAFLEVASVMAGRSLALEFPLVVAAIQLAYIVTPVVSIAYAVFFFMALWWVFKLFVPKQAVVLLLLSIFVLPSMPIIFYVIRNNPPQYVEKTE